MKEPRLNAKDGGNGHARVSPAIFNDAPPLSDRPKRPQNTWVEKLTMGAVMLILSAVVSAGVSFIGGAMKTTAQAQTQAEKIQKLTEDVVRLQTDQAKAAIDAARLAGNYEAVVKSVDQRLELMQQQLNRIETQK